RFVLSIVFMMVAVFAFCEEMTGVYGIKFGSSESEATKIMQSKGWEKCNTDSVVRVSYKNGLYCGKECDFQLRFYEDKLYGAFLVFPCKGTEELVSVINIYKAMAVKYDFDTVKTDDRSGDFTIDKTLTVDNGVQSIKLIVSAVGMNQESISGLEYIEITDRRYTEEYLKMADDL
ncbi:MAG: hypothetical protein Q4F84_05605, partial [Fibrobacter sp.]|nr:hypothetical protein [Fibrobacter sp.]